MSLPAVVKHIGVLEHAGLIRHEKVGRQRICRLEAKPLRKADAWLANYRIFWERRLDGLAEFLEKG
jgi:DNA-binding transcriptional ArsR family regulator